MENFFRSLTVMGLKVQSQLSIVFHDKQNPFKFNINILSLKYSESLKFGTMIS